MADAFTWEYDAEDGVYKNHQISGKLLEHAAVSFLFVPFTRLEPSFGKGKGETVTIIHVKDLAVPTSGQLEEETRIPIDRLQTGKRAITILEWGRGVEYTSLAQQLSKFDPRNMIQKVLVKQMNAVMDKAAAAQFKNAKVCFIPTSLTGGTWDTDGTPSTQATCNLTKAHLGVIRDYMANDLHVPFFKGNHYVGVFTTKALRGIKDDRVIENWHMYLRKGELIFNSEVGQCESVRLVECTHANALDNAIGSGDVTGEGVIFGDEAVTRIEAEFPHLRADPNYQGDFGRLKAVVWYGTVAFGTTWDSADDKEAKIVRWTSS